jgi:acetylornithine deacetylase/succinyl-diaminopimelate desuccinylase-like protein
MSLRDEATALLQELIRLDTVNPPGNETRAAEALQRYLTRNGVESRLVAKTADRANLVARLDGGDGPRLVLLAHTDTVLAEADEWTRDPWSGDLVDDEV